MIDVQRKRNVINLSILIFNYIQTNHSLTKLISNLGKLVTYMTIIIKYEKKNNQIQTEPLNQ